MAWLLPYCSRLLFDGMVVLPVLIIVNYCGYPLSGQTVTMGPKPWLSIWRLLRDCCVSSWAGELGIAQTELQSLAEVAAKEWTGQFNPRPFDAAGALEIYQAAY
jgi:alcohol dehydrogenase class IV